MLTEPVYFGALTLIGPFKIQNYALEEAVD